MIAQLKTRAVGLLLLALLLPVALLGFVCMVAEILCGDIGRARNALRAFDNFGNAGAFGGHWATTISATCWLKRDYPPCAAIVWLLDQLQPGHCQAAAAQEADIRAFFRI